MHFRTARILLLCASVLIGVLIDARPLKDKTPRDSMKTHDQEKRHLGYNDFIPQHDQEESNHVTVFPPGVSTEPHVTPNSCTEEVVKIFNVTEYDYDVNGEYIEVIKEEQHIVTQCCEGYDPESDCTTKINNETSLNDTGYPFDPADPCKDLVCDVDSHAEVRCMIVVTKCGIYLPLFFDVEGGRLVHCSNYPENNGQPVDLEAQLCTGFCADPDPCQDLTCPSNPDAVCVVTGCDCRPTWLLPLTGVEVDCSTGQTVPPKRRRRETNNNVC